MLDHLKKKLDSYIKEKKIASRAIKIQLAYSGGLDSSSLLDALLKIKMEYGFDLFLTYVDYSTSNYSKDVLKYIDSIELKKSNKNIYTSKIDNKINFESEARKVRYDFLRKIHIENSIDFTVTAHHFNDQLETVVMKFIDGSDYVSLQGIREQFGFLFRPILDLSKESIIDYADNNNVIYFEDPSNKDVSFVRNKVRKFIIPNLVKDDFLINKMKKINICSIKKFKKTKEKINQNLREVAFNNNLRYCFIRLSCFEKYDLIEFKIYLTTILGNFFNLRSSSRSKKFWIRAYDFILNSKTGSIFDFSNNIIILKDRNGVFLYDNKFLSEVDVSRIKVDSDFNWGLGRIVCLDKMKKQKNIKDEIILDRQCFSNGVYIRPWKHGDKIIEKNKKISDMLIKMKTPLFIKHKYPILESSNGDIIWVPGAYYNEKYQTNRMEGQKILWME